MGPMRLAELMGTLSLAADVAMGMPMDHGLRSAAVAVRLGELVGAGDRDRADAFYLSLLRYVGCTADSHIAAEVFGDEVAVRGALYGVDWGAPTEVLPRAMSAVSRRAGGGVRGAAAAMRAAATMPKLMGTAQSHCEVGDNLAARSGFDDAFRAALLQTFERWDGGGFPKKLRGEAIALSMRLAHVAEEIETAHLQGGVDAARAVTKKRAGRGLDPRIVERFQESAASVIAMLEVPSAWTTALGAEPAPREVPDEAVDEVLRAMGHLADLKSRFMRRHASGVADLVRAAGRRLRLGAAAERTLERAARVHDLGRVAVSAAVWDKPGALTDPEWELVRIHAYTGERILSRATGLAAVAQIAAMAHERVDGSGYHRRLAGSSCPVSARVLAAADVYAALTEERPQRAAKGADEAAAMLSRMAREGALCPDAVAAVLAVSGHTTARVERPDGITDRELEVLRLVARGKTNKEIATTLDISPKTAGHHVEHIFAKIGVTTRAAAAMVAMQRGLA